MHANVASPLRVDKRNSLVFELTSHCFMSSRFVCTYRYRDIRCPTACVNSHTVPVQKNQISDYKLHAQIRAEIIK